MDRFIQLFFIIFTVFGFLSCSLFADGEESTLENRCPDQIIKDIEPKEAMEMIKKMGGSEKLVILDVRTDGEFKSGHIKAATNVDFLAENFTNVISKFNKDISYLVYCRSGGRSKNATLQMRNLCFKEVYNLSGGINKWTSNGLPVEK